jgi:hypothetical protein
MTSERLPLDFSNIPLGSLYEDRLVEDLLLLVDVVSACRDGDDARLAELGVCAPVPIASPPPAAVGPAATQPA